MDGLPIFGLLLAVMFPMLNAIYSGRSHGRSPMEREDMWSDVVFAFAEAVTGYPILRRQSRVAANLRGDTLRGLKKIARAEILEHQARERLAADASALDECFGVDSADGKEDLLSWNVLLGARRERIATTAMDTTDALYQVELFVRDGKLTEGEAAVVRGVLIGRSLAEVARDLRITWNAAKLRASKAFRSLQKRDDYDDNDRK